MTLVPCLVTPKCFLGTDRPSEKRFRGDKPFLGIRDHELLVPGGARKWRSGGHVCRVCWMGFALNGKESCFQLRVSSCLSTYELELDCVGHSGCYKE